MTFNYRSFLIFTLSLLMCQILVALPVSNAAKEAISVEQLDAKTQQKIAKKQAKIAKKIEKIEYKHRDRRAGRGVSKGLLIMLVGLGLTILGFVGLGGFVMLIGLIALVIGIALWLLRIIF